MTDAEFVEALIAAALDPQARHALIAEHADFARLEILYTLKDRAELVRRGDPHKALAIVEGMEQLAGYVASDEAQAVVFWAQAFVRDSLGELETAAHCHEQAVDLFNKAGKPLQAARTHIAQMYTLIKMGRFERAQSLAEEARRVFVAEGDLLSEAKIDNNLGNLHYRQGQYPLALEDFRNATAGFQALGETLDVAMCQINQANVLFELDDFIEAKRMHELARPVFAAAGLRSAVASVDHDLAILHYASGNYAEAFRTYERARDLFTGLSDQGNLAQVDLEESDLYLSLNLPEEARRLAEVAEHAFSGMGMTFELACARANHGVALARLGHGHRAIVQLEQAHEMFEEQGNESWAAHTDLLQAEVIAQVGRREGARVLASQAAKAYKELGMKTKQAYADILCAKLWTDDGEYARALDELDTARAALDGRAAPWLEQGIETCLGRIYEMTGKKSLAVEHYKTAAGRIEQMTAALASEEHRTAFVADKLAPYEALVSLYAAEDVSVAFQWAEQAKSRALVDLLAAGVRPRLHIQDAMDAQRAERLHVLRDELNWLYTRLTSGAARGEAGAPAGGPETWVKIQEREREATSLWRDLQGRHAEQLSFIRAAPLEPAELQSHLPAGTALIEYFIARGQVMAFVMTRDDLQVFPAIALLADLRPLFENLAFQFSKFQYGLEYYQRHKAASLSGTQDVLAQLGERLLGPFWQKLAGLDALIIVPHGPLHALPFQALRVGGRYVIEDFAVSYAPSSTVLKFCWEKPVLADPSRTAGGRPLLVGVSDERMTHVQEEIEALAGLFGDSTVLLGEQATFQQLQQSAATSGILHLAAHGLFRPEAPLLSSIHLADRWLAVQDIYDLDLHASLVTLSACETGLGQDAGGDDLMGLVRGFLYAGASSLIVSLWTVDDEAMTLLVIAFYTHWLAGQPKARALRQAQLDLLEKYEHPFYWAPLVLVGVES